MNEPLISIIVPAKNAQETIKKCIDSLLNLDYPNYEVIIVNDGSNDATLKLLAEYSQKIKIINNSLSLGPAQSRNIAAQIAKGEYLAFTDADCIVEKNWLKELRAGFTTYDIVSVGGRQEIPNDETVFGRRISLFLKKVGFISDYMHRGKTRIILVNHNASCNVIYRKDIFLRAGGFLEGLWPGEDVEIDYRLRKKGYKLVFNPEAIVYHYRQKDLKSFIKMMYGYGLVQGFLVRKYGIFRRVHIFPLLNIFAIFFLLASLWFNFFSVFLIFSIAALLSLSAYLKFNLNVLLLALLGFLYWNLGFFAKWLFNLKLDKS
jgi:glycosyltransferase involved in cell wall biosynthesis